jgi:hypothetical protein
MIPELMLRVIAQTICVSRLLSEKPLIVTVFCCIYFRTFVRTLSEA